MGGREKVLAKKSRFSVTSYGESKQIFWPTQYKEAREGRKKEILGQQIIQKGDDLKNTIMNILREVKKTLSYQKRRTDAVKNGFLTPKHNYPLFHETVLLILFCNRGEVNFHYISVGTDFFF